MKALLFDLDGTLIDSAQDIALALEKTLKQVGLIHKMPDDVRPFVGGGVKALLERVLGEDYREEFVEIFRSNYRENPVVYTRPFEGVVETLKVLKEAGLRLAVVSNKPEDLSVEILRRLDLADMFDFIAGGDTFPEKKPSPLPIIETLKILDADPCESVMIGDTEADLVAGKGAGTKTALAQWGYVKINSSKPDFYLKRPQDLLDIFNSSSAV